MSSPEAYIEGRAATLDDALTHAAHLLAGSRLPVVAGTPADVASIRASVRLAERAGGVFDHAAAAESLRDTTVLREAGMMLVTPAEARERADFVLLVGSAPLELWPGLLDFLAGGPAGDRPACTVACLGTAAPAGEAAAHAYASALEPPDALAALRARIAGRPVAGDGGDLDRLAAAMKAARYGVVVWAARDLDELAIEMLAGLVKDLNAATRWAGIPVADEAGGPAATTVCGWMTGYPAPIGFGRGWPEHDPWRFDSGRLLASGEGDLLVWVDGGTGLEPPPAPGCAVIALTSDPAQAAAAAVAIGIGRSGEDHDAVIHDRRIATFTAMQASRRSNALPAAEAIARIADRLPC
ncbi:formylmethanofuran dehydrogenase [Faunimonas sp. B44]|uniref:formylmethanofuran dehydrogenase n=1 Tax=Faunimonas sp. B44 TaxID=3461493 RepID=UPI004043A3DB